MSTELNIADMPTDWWAWDGENFYPLGICEDFDEADERDRKRCGLPGNWLFSREALVDMKNKIEEELE